MLYIPFVQSQERRIVRIGVFTDCQYCDCLADGARQYRLSLAKLDSCISTFNSLDLDAVFHLGDMIDHNFSSYDSVLPRFQKFQAPLKLLMGNHDYMIKKKYKDDVTKRLGMIQEEYRHDAGSSEGAYTTVIGSWCFIALNGDDLSYTAPQDKEHKNERNETVNDLYSDLKYNGMPWNGGIGKSQMKWLEEQLIAAGKAGSNVIVLCHFPLFGKQDHLLFNWQEVLALLSRYPCVKAYFNGHYHSGGYKEFAGIHFVNFKGMVDTRRNAFGVITLTSDSILIKGYGREPDRKLKIR